MWLSTVTAWVAPFFIIMSPIISYSDQAISMHRNKTSAGFSLDIPLIMLVSSILKLFYWPGAHFDNSLLIQALIMIVMQIALLKIALDHRPPPSTKGGEASLPFSGVGQDEYERPFNFWQWRSPKPYWHFIVYFFVSLLVAELLLSPFRAIYKPYSELIGYAGLAVEASLPIPQILTNMRSKSCKGFRLSLLGSWVIGDCMKIFWFFTADAEIPWAFKLGGMFQASCDFFLGFQYLMYGEGNVEDVVKEHPMTEYKSAAMAEPNGRPRAQSGHARVMSGHVAT